MDSSTHLHPPSLTLEPLKDKLVHGTKKAYSAVKTSCILRWPGRLPILIWFIGFVVMMALTARDCVPLFNDYRNNNFAALINIKTEPVPPNVTVCLPYYSTMFWAMLPELRSLDEAHLNGSKSMLEMCRTCDAMKNHSWDFWNHVNISQDDAILRYLVEEFLNKSLYRQRLSHSNYEWLQPIVDAVWYYFKLHFEKDLKALTSDNKEDDGYFTFDYGVRFSDDVMDIMHGYLLDSVLASVAGGCTVKPANASTNASGSIEAAVHSSSFSMQGEKFCFQLPPEFGNQDIECAYQHRLYGWHQYPGRAFEVYPTPAALYSVVTPKDAVYSTNQTALQGWESVHLIYDIDSRLIAKRSGESCSNETSTDLCVARKQVKAAVEECKCIPLRFRSLVQVSSNQSLPYCNGHIYITCQERLKRRLNEAQAQCARNNKCEYTFYAWQPPRAAIQWGEPDHVDTPFTLTLGASRKPFIEFSSEEKFTPEQFLSQVGGLLNFYLGVSGLTLFALLIVLIEQVKRWYKLRAKPHQRLEDGSTVAWQYLRMLSIFAMLGAGQKESTESTHHAEEEVRDLKRTLQVMRAENEVKLEEMRTLIRRLQDDKKKSSQEVKLQMDV